MRGLRLRAVAAVRQADWGAAVRRSCWALAGVALVAWAPGCATAPHARAVAEARADLDQPALILATEAYELHLRDGRVWAVQPPDAHTAPAFRQVETWEEFRRLYSVRAGETLPPVAPREGIDVNGWVNLTCVRDAEVCGRQPEPGGRGDAVRVRVVFPGR